MKPGYPQESKSTVRAAFMRQFLPPLRLVGADVLRDGEMQRRSVAFS